MDKEFISDIILLRLGDRSFTDNGSKGDKETYAKGFAEGFKKASELFQISMEKIQEVEH